MWKTVALAAAVLLIGDGALAQSTDTGEPPQPMKRQPGMVGRSVVPIPPGESAADIARRGRGMSDLNSNSATEGPSVNTGAPSGSAGTEQGTGPEIVPGSGRYDNGTLDETGRRPRAPQTR